MTENHKKELTEENQRFLNTIIGIKRFAPGILSPKEINDFARAFHNLITNSPKNSPDRLAESILDLLSTFSTFPRVKNRPTPFQDLSEQLRQKAVQEAMDYVYAHLEIKKSEPTEVKIDGTDVQMKIEYFDSSWDSSIGAIKILLRDNNTNNCYIPIYVIRGVPKMEQKKCAFFINTIQPFINDDEPGISYLIGDKGNKYTDLARQRTRLVNRLTITMNKKLSPEESKNMELSSDDIIILVFLVYMQKAGVKQFYGINHNDHPAVMLGKNISLNYDKLFGKFMDNKFSFLGTRKLRSTKYPYIFAAGSIGTHVPKYDKLPPAMRNLLIKITL